MSADMQDNTSPKAHNNQVANPSVASLALCEELYELSEWGRLGDVMDSWIKYSLQEKADVYPFPYPHVNGLSELQVGALSGSLEYSYPAYDSGYLLRKLPRHLKKKGQTYFLCIINGNANDDNWIADYVTTGRLCWLHEGGKAQLTEDAEIENAIVKLAIQLLKEGVLGK